MERLPIVAECYQKWWELQSQVEDLYSEKERQRPPLSRQKEFRQIKNAVIQEAEAIRMGKITFENEDLRQNDEVDEEDENVSWDFWTLREIIQGETSSLEERDEAVQSMERLGKDGDVHAQCLLGKLWRDGPLLTPDWVNARYWFAKAANQGHAAAQYALGKLYLSDDAEVRNPERGLHWLETAAQNGSHYAAYRLGKEYLEGNTVEKDAARAVEWFTRSAEAGNQYAQYMLGKLYLLGKDLLCDKELAFFWLTASAAQGNQYAQFFLDQQENPQPPSVMLSVTRLLHNMANIFRDNSLPQSGTGLIQVDRKLREKMREKRIAMGHKADDHEEQQNGGWNMTIE